MCGRYSLDADIFAILKRYKMELTEVSYSETDEIFPTDFSPVLTYDKGLMLMSWGFTTDFSKRPLINARGETVAEKPTFKHSFQHNRCIVPATSFFEWRKSTESKEREKLRIAMAENGIFSMAGIYKRFPVDGKVVFRYCILTTAAGREMSKIHDRMPVILREEEESAYLNPDTGMIELAGMLMPSDAELIITEESDRQQLSLMR